MDAYLEVVGKAACTGTHPGGGGQRRGTNPNMRGERRSLRGHTSWSRGQGDAGRGVAHISVGGKRDPNIHQWRPQWDADALARYGTRIGVGSAGGTLGSGMEPRLDPGAITTIAETS